MTVWILVLTLYYGSNSASVTTQEFSSYHNCNHAGLSMRIEGNWGNRLKFVCVEK